MFNRRGSLLYNFLAQQTGKIAINSVIKFHNGWIESHNQELFGTISLHNNLSQKNKVNEKTIFIISQKKATVSDARENWLLKHKKILFNQQQQHWPVVEAVNLMMSFVI